MKTIIVAPVLNHHSLRHGALPADQRNPWLQWMRYELMLSVLCGLLFGEVSAQTVIQYSIDLASTVNETRKISVESDRPFSVKIANKIPGKAYQVTIQRIRMPIAVLPLPAISIIPTDAAKAKCDTLVNMVNAIYNAKKEEEIAARYSQIQEEIKRIRNDLKNECKKELIDWAEATLRLTSEDLGPFTLLNGEELILTISGISDNATRTWSAVYATQPRGEWQISYGFSFITEAFSKQELYFSEPRDSGHIILKESNKKCISFAPSIMFNWMPASQLLCDWSWGVSGGIGFDLANPTVLVGLAVAYNQNLRIHIGLAAHKQKQLLGRYSNNQVVKEALTADQLHTEQFQVNPFFSISFRFNESPFAQAVQK